MTPDVIWAGVGFILTLLVLSYILGDNPLFRFATYLFVGVSAGYVLVMVVNAVLWPRLIVPLLSGTMGERLLALVPLVFSLLLLTRLLPRVTTPGSLPMAYLVGTGAAVAVGGAVIGTILPQSAATMDLFNLRTSAAPGQQILLGVLMLVGVIGTLAYFNFGARAHTGQPTQRAMVVRIAARVGEIFIGITLGALFAGVFAAALTALVERIDFVWLTISTWMGGG